jgi:2-succinyl-5-enolpyruvyl-6-hydroxy-3-cyclohexene-1-carboxylate synthase
VVLCPGSRSAPLAYAAAAAERAGALRLWVRHDERVAGFTALGLSRAGAVAAVMTTSGTAVANLHPALLEAHHAGVPLVVVTADRPAALRGTWANQTSELQAGLFGAALRAQLDTEAAEVEALTEVIRQAFGDQAHGRRPGPVQLNLCLAEPLMPADPSSTAPTWPGDVPVVGRVEVDSPAALTLERGPRTLVVAGDGAGPAARRLAESAGWPLLAEPSSGARCGPMAIGPYRLLLELDGLAAPCARVVVFGRPTLSRPVTRLLGREDVELVVVSPFPDWPVPPARGRLRRASAVVVSGGASDSDDAWARRWSAAGRAAQRALDEALDAEPVPTGPAVARALSRRIGAGEWLVTAASNPIRDLDLAAGVLPDDVPVIANRGLSGIDGTLSTASGIASGSGCPTRVLIGDLAFLHDLNALIPVPGESRPRLQIVVLDDGGGGIFSLLEYGALGERDSAATAVFERVFGTPHRADLAALCLGYGVRHVVARSVAEVDRLLAEPIEGPTVIQVPIDRSGLRALHARLRVAVHSAVRGQRSAIPAAID